MRVAKLVLRICMFILVILKFLVRRDVEGLVMSRPVLVLLISLNAPL